MIWGKALTPQCPDVPAPASTQEILIVMGLQRPLGGGAHEAGTRAGPGRVHFPLKMSGRSRACGSSVSLDLPPHARGGCLGLPGSVLSPHANRESRSLSRSSSRDCRCVRLSEERGSGEWRGGVEWNGDEVSNSGSDECQRGDCAEAGVREEPCSCAPKWCQGRGTRPGASEVGTNPVPPLHGAAAQPWGAGSGHQMWTSAYSGLRPITTWLP